MISFIIHSNNAMEIFNLLQTKLVTYKSKSLLAPFGKSGFGPVGFAKYGDLYSLSSVVLVPREILKIFDFMFFLRIIKYFKSREII